MYFYRLRNRLLRRGPCSAEGVGVVYSFNQIPRLGGPGCSQSHVLIPLAKVIFLTEGTHFLRAFPRHWVDAMGLPGVAHHLQHCHTCYGQSHIIKDTLLAIRITFIKKKNWIYICCHYSYRNYEPKFDNLELLWETWSLCELTKSLIKMQCTPFVSDSGASVWGTVKCQESVLTFVRVWKHHCETITSRGKSKFCLSS